jgi:hypothetical protein
LLNIEIDNTPCIVVVSVDITERKKTEERKGNECAAYFENDEQQRAAELSPIPNCFSKRTKRKRAAELINANNELIFQNEEKVKNSKLIAAKEKAELYLDMVVVLLYLWMKR